MATITDDIHKSADWIARALSGSGYRADFTPESLWEVDRFFEDHSSGGVARPNSLLAKDPGQRIFAIGSYMGEVARRRLGGEWIGNDDDPQAEINVELRFADGVRCWPVQRAMKRFKNGVEDGIAAWGIGVGLDVGPSPSQVQKGLFKRLFG